MKKVFFLLSLFFCFNLLIAQEEQKEEKVQTILEKETQKKPNLKLLDIETIYGYWISYDKENKIIKIKENDNIVEFKYISGITKLLAKNKKIKINDFKEGDYIKILYKKDEEGVNIAKRIVQNPKKPQETPPSTPGN